MSVAAPASSSMTSADSDTLADALIAEWQAGTAQLDLDVGAVAGVNSLAAEACPPSSASQATPLATGKDPLPDHDATLPLACGAAIRCPHTGLAVTTPFHPASWLQLLRNHPDAAWAHRLVHDLVHGVDIGYRGQRSLPHPLAQLRGERGGGGRRRRRPDR